ncbi:MAG TPA: hypothetical protein VG270_04315 [Pseudolabrys sp.]|jgi:hypothetical protein|nr:hypothetical protein [Pseudolabrys sp.]
MSRKDELFCELDRFETHLPKWAARLVKRVRRPGAFWVRIGLGVLLLIGGTVGKIVPGLGFWMLPPGLALLAVDVPFLRGPMAKLLSFINSKLGKA